MSHVSPSAAEPLDPRDHPGGRSGWLLALAASPVYLFIGLSIHDGWPPRDDVLAWLFVLVLPLLSPLTHLVEVWAWHLRERLGCPEWWTASRQQNAERSVWIGAFLAFCMVPASLIGWSAAQHWAVCWAALIPCSFLVGEMMDGAFGAAARAVRRAPPG